MSKSVTLNILQNFTTIFFTTHVYSFENNFVKWCANSIFFDHIMSTHIQAPLCRRISRQ